MLTIKKLLVQIAQDQKDIKATLSPEIIKKAKERDEMLNWLASFGLIPLKHISVVDNQLGGKTIKIEYDILPEYVILDTDGDLTCTDRFKAMNALDLVGVSDQEKISTAIEKAQKELKTK